MGFVGSFGLRRIRSPHCPPDPFNRQSRARPEGATILCFFSLFEHLADHFAAAAGLVKNPQLFEGPCV